MNPRPPEPHSGALPGCATSRTTGFPPCGGRPNLAPSPPISNAPHHDLPAPRQARERIDPPNPCRHAVFSLRSGHFRLTVAQSPVLVCATMFLPNPDLAVVDPAKIQRYLLSSEHPEGRFKSVVFERAGYRPAEWQILQQHLAATARREVRRVVPTPFGHQYEISAILRGPAGRDLAVVAAWLVRRGEAFPRLVTAYPRSRP